MCLIFVGTLLATCFEVAAAQGARRATGGSALIVMFVLLGGDPSGGATLARILGAAAFEARGAWNDGHQEAPARSRVDRP